MTRMRRALVSLAAAALLAGCAGQWGNSPADIRARYPDLAGYEAAFQAQIAQSLDAGEITPEEAAVLRSELDMKVTGEALARDGAEQQRQSAAFAQAYQGLALMNQANQPPPRQGLTCTQQGVFTQCW